MGEPIFFTTPKGDHMAIIAVDDDESLIDAADETSDILAVEKFKQRLAAGEEEFIPAAMVQRMIAGESPVRVWREHRGLTVQQLANAAGLDVADLSRIESGAEEGTLCAMKRIAGSLRVLLDDIA